MSVTISQYAERYFSEANLILLMVEILHQLIGSLSHYLQGLYVYTFPVVQDFLRPDNWQVLWKRPHPWPSQDLISWHLGRSETSMFWKRPQLAQRCIKTCCDMMEQTWTNQKKLFIYIYNLFIYIYNFISSCRNSYPSSTGFFPIRLCPFHSQS